MGDQPAPVVAPGDDYEAARLTAAQACFLESEWHTTDCTAILFVANKRAVRAGWSWPQMLRAYSAVGRGGSRARIARHFPWGDIPDHPPAFNRHWRELREHVVRVLDGEVRDPCPRAVNWGSRTYATDVRRARHAIRTRKWRMAYCAEPTVNQFYVDVAPHAEVLQ